jgi:predicted membrane channel-forming protein YqfA (hemolysin III family)
MALTYKARKRWALFVLILGLPIYIVMAVTIMNWLYPDPLNRPSVWIEIGVYVGLGVLWAFPLRSIFKGIGQADPDRPEA